MTGQAGQLQPDGQAQVLRCRSIRAVTRIPSGAWLVAALVGLALPFNRGGIWDPYELRIAELGRRLAPQLFDVRPGPWAKGVADFVTAKEIGQGELTTTSSALGFALFGVSDWAGRITSLFWGVVAVLALWLVMGRLSGRIAQITSVLILVSTPLFAWQSRTMLGDSATIATQTLAMVGLLLAFREGADVSRASRISAALVASIGMGLGYLCRGVLPGIAAPTLAVGLIDLVCNSAVKGARGRKWCGAGLLIVGLAFTAVGVGEAVWAKDGYSLLLGATLRPSVESLPFDSSFGTLLHQTFPLSAFLPWSIAGLVMFRRQRGQVSNEQRMALAFALVCAFALVDAMIMARRGASFAFPSISALAGLTGISVQKLSHRRATSSAATVAMVSMSVLLFADFTNAPATQLLLTGITGGQLPESFVIQGQPWLRAALAALLVGGVITILFNTAPSPRAIPWRARLVAPFDRVRSAFGGQLLSGLVLVETALGTLALLQRAHDEGWISVPWFDTTRALIGPSLSWAWTIPPALLFVVPAAEVLLRVIGEWLVARRSSAEIATTVAWPPALVGATALVVAGLMLTLGHAPLLAEQLSPKRVALQYRAHARAGEELGLLGLRPESVRYYLGVLPKSFQDIGLAAQWLHEGEPKRRWLMMQTEHLAETNAAFRSESKQNLMIADVPASSLVLATNHPVGSEVNNNPIANDVLSSPPATNHAVDFEFGGIFTLIGWDVRSEQGQRINRLRIGTPYELRLVFRVLGTTQIDWEIFVHLDGYGKRHNGDHEPVLGHYPTTLWQSGDVIVDRHRLVLERGSTPGSHTLFMGLFRGSRRLEVTRGAHTENRVTLGAIDVE